MTASLTLIELAPAQAPWPLLLLADPDSQQVMRYLPDSRVLALAADEHIVGVVVITDRAEGEAEVTNLAVDEAWQGHGLGRRLLESAIAQARARGLQRLAIATGNSSLAQLGLYQRVGFRIVGVDPDYFVRHYPEPIIENGIACRDQLRLVLELRP